MNKTNDMVIIAIKKKKIYFTKYICIFTKLLIGKKLLTRINTSSIRYISTDTSNWFPRSGYTKR